MSRSGFQAGPNPCATVNSFITSRFPEMGIVPWCAMLIAIYLKPTPFAISRSTACHRAAFESVIDSSILQSDLRDELFVWAGLMKPSCRDTPLNTKILRPWVMTLRVGQHFSASRSIPPDTTCRPLSPLCLPLSPDSHCSHNWVTILIIRALQFYRQIHYFPLQCLYQATF